MDIVERLKELAETVTQGRDAVTREFTMRVPAEPERDADLVLSRAADEISRLRGAQAADDERLETASRRVGIVAGCDAAEWMADEIARLRDQNARLQSRVEYLGSKVNSLHNTLSSLQEENASLSAQLTAFQTVWPGGVDEVPSMIRTFLEKVEKLERGEYICKKCETA